MYVLTYNLDIVKTQLKSFDTLYKFFNGILWSILMCIDQNNIENKFIIYDIIGLLFAILCVTCLDGWYVYNHSLKIFEIIGAILFIILLTYIQYNNYDSDCDSDSDSNSSDDSNDEILNIYGKIFSLHNNIY